MARAFPCLVSLLFAALTALPARAEEERLFPVDIHEKTLDNGLRILVLPRKGVPAAACAVVYRVGSAQERPGATGMAHFLEHMMFKGTRKVGVRDLGKDRVLRGKLDEVARSLLRWEDAPPSTARTEALARLRRLREDLFREQKENLEVNHLFRIYGEAGGSFTNAFTSWDMTAYIVMLPPEKLELFFWIESDRMQNVVFRQFHAEKEVVREERRMYENRPGALFGEEVQRALFGAHPYAHPVLGYHEDVRRLSREDLRGFWRRHYGPDNAFLFLGGDVDPARAFALAEAYFGPVPARNPERGRVPVLRITHGGELRLYGEGPGEPRVAVRFRVPPGGCPEELALDFLALHLGGEDGPLHRALVEEKKTAASVDARYDARRYGGVFSVSAELAPGASAVEAETALHQAVAACRDRRLDDAAMRRLRRRYRAGILGSVKSEMRLGMLLLSREMIGSWRDIEDLLRLSRDLPADALQKAARSYLLRDNCVVSVYESKPLPPAAVPHRPRTAGDRPAPADGDGRPASWKDLRFPPSRFEVPAAREHRSVLENGLRIFAARGRGEPTVRISATVLGGSAADPKGSEGLTSLAASLLERAGVPGRDRASLRAFLEDRVASVSASAGLYSHRLELECFPADLDECLDVFRALLCEPVLDEEVFRRERLRLEADIRDRDSRPNAVTAQLLRCLLWGDAPAARHPSAGGLRSLSFEDVQRLVRRRTAPSRVVLAVSGDLPAGEAVRRLRRLFGSWKARDAAPARPPGPKNDPDALRPGLHLRPMRSSQGCVRIGTCTVPLSHEDALCLRCLGAVLSRRVFDTIRSVHGLSYSAGVRLGEAWVCDAPLVLSFQTKSASVPFALELAAAEIGKMREKGPTEEEMALARRRLRTSLRARFGRARDLVDTFARLVALGVDPDHYRDASGALARLDAEAVRKAAERYLAPGRLVVLCVGDIEAMRRGDGVHEASLDAWGSPTMHEAAAAPAAAATPRGLVRLLLDAVRSGDVEALREHASKKLRKLLDENPEQIRQLKGQAAMLASATFAVEEAEVEGDAATVPVRVSLSVGGSPMKVRMVFALRREGGAWKCDGFRLER